MALSLSTRATSIRVAGWLVLLTAAGAAALPFLGRDASARLLATMMLVTGAIEIFAGAMRHETPKLAMTAGAASIVAGLLFLNDLSNQWTPFVTILIGWLAVRAVLLAIASRLETGGLRFWTSVAAATDTLLALILLVGLSIASLVLAIFGNAEPLVASFAWVLAGSFVASGLLLLEVASCSTEGDI